MRHLTLVEVGFEISATVDEQERVVLSVASGELDREGLIRWLGNTVVQGR